MAKPSINLDLLTEILFEETSCIANDDVPVLLDVIYSRIGLKTPQFIIDEIDAQRVGRGD